MPKIILNFILIFCCLIACVKESKLPIKEEKVLSFYKDFYLYTEHYRFLPDSIKKPSSKEITKLILKKNKLTEKELKKINQFYYLNPSKYNLILEKIKKRLDSLVEINNKIKEKKIEEKKVKPSKPKKL